MRQEAPKVPQISDEMQASRRLIGLDSGYRTREANRLIMWRCGSEERLMEEGSWI